jgi:hypothetical protein
VTYELHVTGREGSRCRLKFAEEGLASSVASIPHSRIRMKKTFVETREFTEWVVEHLSDHVLGDLHPYCWTN